MGINRAASSGTDAGSAVRSPPPEAVGEPFPPAAAAAAAPVEEEEEWRKPLTWAFKGPWPGGAGGGGATTRDASGPGLRRRTSGWPRTRSKTSRVMERATAVPSRSSGCGGNGAEVRKKRKEHEAWV